MSISVRRNHSASFKAKVALEALRGERTAPEIAANHGIHHTWRLSNTMEADFCIEALEEALTRYGKPEIFNSDQGSQFTSTVFASVQVAARGQLTGASLGRHAKSSS